MKSDRLAIRELVEAYARWKLFPGGVTRRITLEALTDSILSFESSFRPRPSARQRGLIKNVR
jgi:hypothetical protein